MKKIFLMLSTFCALHQDAQILFQENFTSFTGAGWNFQNKSTPLATPGRDWFTPNSALSFTAYNGSPDDFIAANFASSSDLNNPQTLSNWLLTPTITLMNGNVLEFATRTLANPTASADRLEVYFSDGGPGINVGTTATSVGTFSNLLVSINASLTATGYPGTWTLYTATLSGLPAPVTGRFGFRYFVTNGGLGGSNSNFIGLDAIKYFKPCGLSVPNYTICSGQSLVLAPTATAGPTSYTWSTGGNGNSVAVAPTAASAFTLNYEEYGTPCPAIVSSVSIGPNLSVNMTSAPSQFCAGTNVTLTASGSANTYNWGVTGGSSSIGSTSVIVVNPSGPVTYTVSGSNGGCTGTNSLMVNPQPLPTLSYILSPSVICTNRSYTLTGSGAFDYFWFLAPTVVVLANPFDLTAVAPGPRNYTLQGISLAGCSNTLPVNFYANASPTISASPSSNTVCLNDAITLTATGADSYSWSGAASSTVTPFIFTAGSTGNQTFQVTGTEPTGCSSSASFVVNVLLCNTNPVGIRESFNSADITFSPNPFSDHIRVNVPVSYLEFYNHQAQLLFTLKNEEINNISTSELPPGVYILKAFNDRKELLNVTRLLKVSH